MKMLTTGIVLLIGGIFIFYLFTTNGGTNGVPLGNEEFSQVSIKADNASIEFIPVADNEARVELSNKKNNYKLQADVKGDTLEVKVKKKWFRFISFFNFSNPTLSVYVPKQDFDRILVNTDNGKINIEDLQIEHLDAETDNGTITVRNVTSSDVYLETDNGKINMENITGNITGKTDNGKISLVTDTLDRHLNLKTDNGAIDIQTKTEPTNIKLDIKVDNGAVTVFGDSFYDTLIGDGEYEVKLKTDNGRITIDRY